MDIREFTDIRKEAEKTIEKIRSEAEGKADEGRSWARDHWYVFVILLGFIVGCSAFWAMIQ
jgi:hypothetical protein